MPHHKSRNDNCFVEQKNDYAVRSFVGYFRYDSDEDYHAICRVYSVLNPLLNYFYQSQKIIAKTRQGARVYKTYEAFKTPYERLIESPHIAPHYKQLTRQQKDSLSHITQTET